MTDGCAALDILTEKLLDYVQAEHPPNRRKPWSAEHDLRIAHEYRIVGAKALARALGRTVHAVQNRASVLGAARGICGRGHTWTPQEDRAVTVAVQRLSEILGRDVGAVGARCRTLAYKADGGTTRA
jgi:hypothetical protein